MEAYHNAVLTTFHAAHASHACRLIDILYNNN